nr:hypothetical protein [uncultured Zobellia sp.]
MNTTIRVFDIAYQIGKNVVIKYISTTFKTSPKIEKEKNAKASFFREYLPPSKTNLAFRK